ncbi:MAG: MBL fold metallo-hydrolase [Spirochaetes bacterium]|nr:MBL fold metallo-hydrolase [Spirochaetota bacterium]
MNIKFYGYNTFIIEAGDKKIAIDPGALFLYYFRLTSVIPPSEWANITHILVTHGDPDHYWHADRMAEISHAPIIFNKTMIKNINGKSMMLAPRQKGLSFTTPIDNFFTLEVQQSIEVDGVKITGLKATHGPLAIKLGPINKVVTPGPEERIGWGAIGFQIEVDGFTLVNLGDTIMHLDEWASIQKPDVLMIPIGGKKTLNTMNEEEALKVVRQMKPKLVIPCHYNCPAFFSKKYNPADEMRFTENVEKLGIQCKVLRSGDSTQIFEN